MHEIIYHLPYPPSLNRYWRHVGARTLLSQAGRRYRHDVATCCMQQGIKKTLLGRLSVTLNVFVPDRRKRDLDNIPKAILDALEIAKVYVDDSQIDELKLLRCGMKKPGLVIAHISVRGSHEK